ncbi:hypothetical protein Tco_0493130 [Tanacetum coccineum]
METYANASAKQKLIAQMSLSTALAYPKISQLSHTDCNWRYRDSDTFVPSSERLQVKQKDNGIFISQDKYVADILKKFDFSSVKTASTPLETNKALIKDKEAEDVDVPSYSKDLLSLIAVKRSLDIKRPPKLGLVYSKLSLAKTQEGMPRWIEESTRNEAIYTYLTLRRSTKVSQSRIATLAIRVRQSNPTSS